MMAIIIIDPGHGGSDSGATGNGLLEKNVTLTIAGKVQSYLLTYYQNADARVTRWSDTYVSLSERCNIANNVNADFFLSIHINAGGGTGYEDYIYSGLSPTGSTAQKRTTFHNAVIPVLQKYGLRDRGKKQADFYVLRNTNMDAILAETAFIDTAFDAGLLRNNTFLNDLSAAYAKGIAAILGLQPTGQPAPAIYYDIIVGGFAEDQVDAAFDEMKAAFPDWYMYKQKRS
jgi:N-acetylmuramoyl-L-alanine amidase